MIYWFYFALEIVYHFIGSSALAKVSATRSVWCFSIRVTRRHQDGLIIIAGFEFWHLASHNRLELKEVMKLLLFYQV
jgi:hypothetical protein